jgi:acetyl-CoA carboxylase biotin carboxyl carrier protein
LNNDLPLSPEDVADIIAILDGGSYQLLDIKTVRFRLRVARNGDGGPQKLGWSQEWDYSDDTTIVKSVATAVTPDDDVNAIRAPLPGTFYRAPSPGTPPFVDVGSKVDPDTVIGIIETMKLMNPVHAGASGIITTILADNGEMVAKHATLMRLA